MQHLVEPERRGVLDRVGEAVPRGIPAAARLEELRGDRVVVPRRAQAGAAVGEDLGQRGVLAARRALGERLPEVLKLTKAEQAELYSELGDLLARDDAWDQLSPEVIAELDRRMEDYRADPSTGRTWEEVKEKIAADKRPE